MNRLLRVLYLFGCGLGFWIGIGSASFLLTYLLMEYGSVVLIPLIIAGLLTCLYLDTHYHP